MSRKRPQKTGVAPYTKYKKRPYTYSPKLQAMLTATSESERRRLRDEHTIMMLGYIPKVNFNPDEDLPKRSWVNK